MVHQKGHLDLNDVGMRAILHVCGKVHPFRLPPPWMDAYRFRLGGVMRPPFQVSTLSKLRVPDVECAASGSLFLFSFSSNFANSCMAISSS